MVRALFTVMGAGLLAGSAAGYAQETLAEPTRVSPGASTRVWIMAAWDDKCRPLPAPRIEVVTTPAKGAITFREGQATTVKSSKAGTCIGTPINGTGVYYTANAGAEGADSFAIEARLPTGEVATRGFRMNIAD